MAKDATYADSAYMVEVDTARQKVSAMRVHISDSPISSSVASFSRTQLQPDDLYPYSDFGRSIAMDGDLLIVGSTGKYVGSPKTAGAIYAYRVTTSGVTFIRKITPSDGHTADLFGWSVAVCGSVVLVGAPGKTGGGCVYFFEDNDTGVWPEQCVVGSDTASGDQFGHSVAIVSGKAVVGARYDNSSTGSAYVFTGSATSWTQSTKLTASDGASGDSFGWAVGLSDTLVAVGSPYDDDVAANSGSMYLYAWGTWSETKVQHSDPASGDHFGSAVSVCDDDVLVGAPEKNGAGGEYQAGIAYLFESGSQARKIAASDAVAGDRFGCAVCMKDRSAIVGAFAADTVPASGDNFGKFYVFLRSTWGEYKTITDTWETFPTWSDSYLGSSVFIEETLEVYGAGSPYQSDPSVSYAWGAAHVWGDLSLPGPAGQLSLTALSMLIGAKRGLWRSDTTRRMS